MNFNINIIIFNLVYNLLKVGWFEFLDVRPTGYYCRESLVTTGIKFIVASIANNGFTRYEYMKQKVLKKPKTTNF